MSSGRLTGAGSMINGQNHVAARHAGLRFPAPPRSTDSARNKGHKPSGKFRAFLARILGWRQAG